MEGAIVELAPNRRSILEDVALPGWRVVRDLADIMDDELDILVETTGHLAARAIDKLACGGQLLLVGLKRSEVTIDPGLLADRSVSVIGSIDSIDTFSDALSLITAGRIPVAGLVSRTLALDDWQGALDLLGAAANGQAPSVMKVIFVP
jgi:threonine dehydrogenase-like Zn-dependent dehydrogenase